jgi:hypothetical protein
MVMEIEFEPGTSGGPLSEDYLARTEKMLRLSLPKDYVELLRRANGGVPVAKFFRFGRNEKVVERFLSVIENYKTDPLGWYDIGVVWSQIEGRLDDSLIPFAALFAGDFLCFDCDVGTEPAVVIWDHERSEDDQPVTQPVATSFPEFAAKLHT